MARGCKTSRLVAVAMCLMVLVGVGFDRGLALCIAEDGHAAIEVAHLETHCTTETRRHHGTETSSGLAELDAHGCTDMALSQPSLRGATDSRSAPGLAAGAHRADHLASATAARSALAGSGVSLVEAHLSCLATVVLRT